MSEQLQWTELDQRAVDTGRALAADAVQKVGNGHPGTAVSLSPVAYLLFQKVMRSDPKDPKWLGRDRFVLSIGHSSLTLYNQLYFAGYGLELEDLQALRTAGSQTPAGDKICCKQHETEQDTAQVRVEVFSAPPCFCIVAHIVVFIVDISITTGLPVRQRQI